MFGKALVCFSKRFLPLRTIISIDIEKIMN
jgi:hypothetical protein